MTFQFQKDFTSCLNSPQNFCWIRLILKSLSMRTPGLPRIILLTIIAARSEFAFRIEITRRDFPLPKEMKTLGNVAFAKLLNVIAKDDAMSVKGSVKNPMSLSRFQREIRTLLNLFQTQIRYLVMTMTFSTTQDMTKPQKITRPNLLTVLRVDIQHGIATHLSTFQNNTISIMEAHTLHTYSHLTKKIANTFHDNMNEYYIVLISETDSLR